MKKLIDGFIDYLINIGILSKETKENFIDIYSSYMSNDDNENKDCFIESSIMSLIHYIYHLDSTKKRKMMQGIVQNYFTNSAQAMHDKLKRLISVIKHNHIDKSKPSLINTFNQWKIIERTPSLYISHNTSSITTLEQMHIDLHSKEYIQSNRTLKYYNSNKNSTNCSPSKKQISPIFDNRQIEFIQRRKEKRELLANSVKIKELSQCTFSPKINPRKNFKSNNNSPAHIRLYMDDSNKKKKILSKLKEITEQIKVNSNQQQNKTIDINRIQMLYDECRIKKGLMIKLNNDYNDKSGIAFTPNFRKPQTLKNNNHKPTKTKISLTKQNTFSALEILPEENNANQKKQFTLSGQFQENNYHKKESYQKSYTSTITPSSNLSNGNCLNFYS